jgi:phosphoribosylanthranilate isomerase
MVWIKICGNTNLEDARVAVEAGVDALGFIFARHSPRCISADRAAEIIRELPPEIEKVGVFTNAPVDEVFAVAQQAGLTAVQLHGSETPDDARRLDSPCAGCRLRVFKSLHVAEAQGISFAESRVLGEHFDALLLDSSKPGFGGTGRTFDWEQAAPLIKMLGVTSKLIVAGGLTPENVGEAIAKFRPYGVDAVTGAEREPGKKDHDKVRAFVKAARAASNF